MIIDVDITMPYPGLASDDALDAVMEAAMANALLIDPCILRTPNKLALAAAVEAPDEAEAERLAYGAFVAAIAAATHPTAA